MNKIDTWGVYLYALSAGLSRGGSGVPEPPNDRRDLISPERARLGNVLQPRGSEHLCVGLDSGRRYRLSAVRHLRRMRDSPHVHQLNKHLAARAADSFGHFTPADDPFFEFPEEVTSEVSPLAADRPSKRRRANIVSRAFCKALR